MNKIRLLFTIFLICLVFPGCPRGQINLEYYYSTHCPSCDKILQVLNELSSRKIRVRSVNVLTDKGLDRFLVRLDELGLDAHPGRLPMLFIDETIYQGAEDILAVIKTLKE